MSPDGTVLAAGLRRMYGRDGPLPGQVRLYDASTGEEVARLPGVIWPAIAPDGSAVVASGDGVVDQALHVFTIGGAIRGKASLALPWLQRWRRPSSRKRPPRGWVVAVADGVPGVLPKHHAGWPNTPWWPRCIVGPIDIDAVSCGLAGLDAIVMPMEVIDQQDVPAIARQGRLRARPRAQGFDAAAHDRVDSWASPVPKK